MHTSNTCNLPLTPSSAVYDVLKTPSKWHIYTRSVVDDMLVNIQSTRGNQVTKLHPKHKHTQHASSSVSWRSLTTKLYTSDTRRPPCRFSVCEGRSTHTHTHTSSHPVLAGAREQLGYRLAGLPATAYSIRRVGPGS